MKKRNIFVTLECFIKKDGKYLMLHRSPNKKIMPGVWMAPGGKREFNEGLFECARREVFEETGLTIKNLRIKATGCAYLKDLGEEFFFHFVFADYAGGELKPSAEGELEWLTQDEIGQLDNVLAEIKVMFPYLFTDDGRIYSFKVEYEKGNKLSNFLLEKS